jgi:hypothetical protein
MTSRLLCWLPLAAALASPVPLLAQDWTPVGDRILSDPTYLPLQGQLYGDSAYQFGSVSTNVFAGGTQTSSSHATTNALSQYFAYGVTNQLSVNVSDAYDWSHTFVAPAAASDFDRNANGFQDPTFGLTYRLLDQRAQPLDVDLAASYSPDFIGARSASALENGNEARAGDQLNLRLAVGRETRFMTIQGYFDETHDGEAKVVNALGEDSTTSGFWQPKVGLATQTRFTDRLSLNVGGEYDFPADYAGLDPAGVGTFTNRGDFGNVSASLNYHFIPNRLVGSVVYSHTFYSPTSVSYLADPADDYNVQHSGDAIGAEVRYVFR